MEHATDEIKRTCEIEEFTNTYIIHPISSWLVPQFIKHNICLLYTSPSPRD